MYSDFYQQTSKGDLASVQLDFRAYSLLLDNLTNQWLYIPSRSRFIPPYQIGVVVSLPGVISDSIQLQAPVIATQLAVVNDEYFTATYTDQAIPASPGFGANAARPAFYDSERHPLIEALTWALGPASDDHIIYTVPAGRAFHVGLMQIQGTASAAGAGYTATINLQDASKQLIGLDSPNPTVNVTERVVNSADLFLPAGTAVHFNLNAGLGASVEVVFRVSGTEFDQ